MGEDSEEDDRPAAKQPPVAHIPSSTIHSFAGAPKADTLIKKLGELNSEVDVSAKLSDAEFKAVQGGCAEVPHGRAPRGPIRMVPRCLLVGLVSSCSLGGRASLSGRLPPPSLLLHPHQRSLCQTCAGRSPRTTRLQ